MIKKVKEILFDDEINMPIFILEDGTKMEAYEEQAQGQNLLLSWREDKK